MCFIIAYFGRVCVRIYYINIFYNTTVQQGVANQSKRCAMCRQEIPCDYLENPSLVNPSIEGGIVAEQEVTDNEYQWFYEGRNGKLFQNYIC